MSSAILVATAAAEAGGPAALLCAEGTTLVGRLCGQLRRLEVERLVVVTRPEWESAVTAALTPGREPAVEVRSAGTLAATFAVIAEEAPDGHGTVVVLEGEILVHDAVLAGLLRDPRVQSGIVSSGAFARASGVYQVRNDRGRITSAASPYHRVHRATGASLGLLKIAAADRAHVATAASALAELCRDALPDAWQEELADKVTSWGALFFSEHAGRVALVDQLRRTARTEKWLPDADDLQDGLDADFQSAVLHRAAVAGEDALPILVTALVRADVTLKSTYLRDLYWARPLRQEATDLAVDEMRAIDEDRVLLASAVKADDGFFTTYFVSTYSRYVARWCARRGLTPNQVTTISMGLGALSAAAFALGTRTGLVVGALLLQVAFTADCVDGQLARYTRQFSKLGAWLDSVFDRGKEYLAYAGLALGATRAGSGREIWAFAGAALALQTLRHFVDFSWAGEQHTQIAAVDQPPLTDPEDGRTTAVAGQDASTTADEGEDVVEEVFEHDVPRPQAASTGGQTLGRMAIRASVRLEALPLLKWGKRILVLPIGERFALISLTAAIGGPRTAFLALLIWGSVAATYTTTGRVLRSIA